MKKTNPQKKLLSMFVLGAFLTAAVLLPLSSALAAADDYPGKSVRFVIAFAPGGSTDIIGRLIAMNLSERLGQQFVVDNRSGAGGTLGTDLVARAAPDGYTLLFNSAAYAINPHLYKVPYDPVKSFVPVAKIGDGPNVLTVHPSVPANSVKELIDLAKKEPGKLIAAAAGIGSQMHMATELFRMLAGIDIKIVQFKGGGPALIDVLGGHSHISCGTLTMSLPHIQAGKLKALGYGGARRTKILPDLPTLAEAGVPGYESAIWWGIFAPAGTPKAVTDRLYKELVEIMNMEDVQKIFDAQAADMDLLDSAQFAKFIEAEGIKWGKVIKEANIKTE